MPDFKLPVLSTIRRQSSDIYVDTITAIRKVIGENSVYIMADETTDVQQRYVLNILVGVLNGEPSKSMLISSKQLDAANHETVSQAVISACSTIWPSGINFDRVKLFLSDQAKYMIKAESSLKNVFPQMKHVSCIVHVLNLVAEKIREINPLTNQLIASMKQIFSKCARRKLEFQSITKLKLPPKVGTTRWCTWLIAANYYNDNFDVVKLFVSQLEDETIACSKLRDSIKKGFEEGTAGDITI